jgi:probable F420-dependent oxidoreductase
MTTRFSIAIPQTFPDGRVNVALVRESLAKAEELGFESAWVAEKLFGPLNTLEAFTLLTYAAGITTKIRLGCAVLLTAVRGPMLMAKMLATLDQLSQGRLIVGVGLGAYPDFFLAQGLSPEKRGKRFEEGLHLMNALWTENVVNFDGEFYKIKDRQMEPKPHQKPKPPLIFGAMSPAGIARAVRLGDGFIGAGAVSTAAFYGHAREVRDELGRQNRDPATFSIGKRVYLAIDKDEERAGKRMREWYGAWYGRPELADATGVWGSPAKVIDELQRVVAGGAQEIMLNPVFDEVEQMEILKRDVVPAMR